MKTFKIDLRSKDITNDDFETVHDYENDGVKIEIENDGGNWWISNVFYNNEESNALDTPGSFENNSLNDKIDNLLREGLDIETACEEAGAKWIININDDRYIKF